MITKFVMRHVQRNEPFLANKLISLQTKVSFKVFQPCVVGPIYQDFDCVFSIQLLWLLAFLVCLGYMVVQLVGLFKVSDIVIKPEVRICAFIVADLHLRIKAFRICSHFYLESVLVGRQNLNHRVTNFIHLHSTLN